jgi:hypothetical protein
MWNAGLIADLRAGYAALAARQVGALGRRARLGQQTERAEGCQRRGGGTSIPQN